MPWQKGQSGNPHGSKPEKLIRDAIILALKDYDKDKKTKRLRIVAEALVKEAMNGNVAAIKEVGDRVDGKAIQPLSGADGEGPVKLVVEIIDDVDD